MYVSDADAAAKGEVDPPHPLVRAWALKRNLINEGQRGALPREIVQAYKSAHAAGRKPPDPAAAPTRPAPARTTTKAAGSVTTGSVTVAGGKVTVYTVKSPTGTDVRLLARSEADWYTSQRDKYMSQNHFVNISDLQDLDRLLTLEVMIHRWSSWLTQGFEYDGAPAVPHVLKTNIADYSREIRAVKAALGIDRVTRDKDKGETVGDYISTLLARAKEFGVHRNKEYELAVTFLWELISRIQTYDRCDVIERRELNLSPETIVAWVREEVMPEWDRVSASFQERQKVWIREL